MYPMAALLSIPVHDLAGPKLKRRAGDKSGTCANYNQFVELEKTLLR